ncbi:MAG: hypothetical protein PQJ46_10100, partial [Spirochaetales bacterium]|nr:hypothetical protein [Spirochaetales bacterium]
HFSGASLIFDATSKQGLKISNRYVRKTGNKNAEMYFGLKNVKKYAAKVSPKIKVGADYPFFSRIDIDKNWSRDTKFRMRFSDTLNMVKLIRFDFE